jgi:hypothetical protein
MYQLKLTRQYFKSIILPLELNHKPLERKTQTIRIIFKSSSFDRGIRCWFGITYGAVSF